MRILGKTGRPDLAEIFIAQLREGPEHRVEFVDSCGSLGGQRRRKWVLIISTQFGCPVACRFCDAGSSYHGNLRAEEMIWQIESLVGRYENLRPGQCDKFKIQFARMGEPALNDAVLEVLKWMIDKYPYSMPCIATLAPATRDKWFQDLLGLSRYFKDFQLQFSLHTTDLELADALMPIEKMDWRWIADYGLAFYRPGLRKPSLNFALSDSLPLDPEVVAQCFDPDVFAIKLTPLNPTRNTAKNDLAALTEAGRASDLWELRASQFAQLGFQVITAIGDWEENRLGSNCGQVVGSL